MIIPKPIRNGNPNATKIKDFNLVRNPMLFGTFKRCRRNRVVHCRCRCANRLQFPSVADRHDPSRQERRQLPHWFFVLNTASTVSFPRTSHTQMATPPMEAAKTQMWLAAQACEHQTRVLAEATRTLQAAQQTMAACIAGDEPGATDWNRHHPRAMTPHQVALALIGSPLASAAWAPPELLPFALTTDGERDILDAQREMLCLWFCTSCQRTLRCTEDCPRLLAYYSHYRPPPAVSPPPPPPFVPHAPLPSVPPLLSPIPVPPFGTKLFPPPPRRLLQPSSSATWANVAHRSSPPPPRSFVHHHHHPRQGAGVQVFSVPTGSLPTIMEHPTPGPSFFLLLFFLPFFWGHSSSTQDRRSL